MKKSNQRYYKITYLKDGDWFVVRVKDGLARVIHFTKGYKSYEHLEYNFKGNPQNDEYFKTEELTKKQVKNLWIYDI